MEAQRDSGILASVPWLDDAEEVDTVGMADVDCHRFYRDYVNRNRPCLIRGAVSDWPAIVKWNCQDYLDEVSGSNEVTIYRHKNYIEGSRFRTAESIKFSAALDLLFGSGEAVISLPSVRLPTTGPFSELLLDIQSEPFKQKFGWLNDAVPLFFSRERFFMYRGGGTAWHHHPTDETLLCQIVNSKKVGLVSTALAPREFKLVNSAFARINRGDYSQRSCSEFEGLRFRPRTLRASLFAGDALYIPPHWWHGVEAMNDLFGASVAVCARSSFRMWGHIECGTVRELWSWALRNPKRYGHIAKRGIPGLISKFINSI